MRVAFWLLAKGWDKRDYPKEAENSKIFVGNVDDPIAIIKRKDIVKYIDSTFYRLYNIWYKFHMGFGLPQLKSWSQHPVFLIDAIELFEAEYRKVGV